MKTNNQGTPPWPLAVVLQVIYRKFKIIPVSLIPRPHSSFSMLHTETEEPGDKANSYTEFYNTWLTYILL